MCRGYRNPSDLNADRSRLASYHGHAIVDGLIPRHDWLVETREVAELILPPRLWMSQWDYAYAGP
jgi:hypothetical protein